MTTSDVATRPIPLVDLAAQYATIRPEIETAIAGVLEAQSFILGPEVAAFEREFAAHVGAAGAVGVASGTAALELALLACGIGAGDEVITTSHTFIATAEAISHTGARPIFVDIEPETFNIDPERIEAAITPRTRAIVPVHLYGQPADLPAILDIAARHGLRVIEDAAQSHGAEIDGRRCGSIGDLASWSFYPGKNLGAYGDAGAVTGMDDALLARVRKLRDHGRTSKYEHDEIGFGERMDAIQGAILRVKLRHLEAWTERRRAHAQAYADGLANLEAIRLPAEAPGRRHVYHLFVIRTDRRDALLDHLKQAGIGAGIHYPLPVHRQPAYLAQTVGVDLPETDAAAREVLSLPMYPELDGPTIERVIDAVREFAA